MPQVETCSYCHKEIDLERDKYTIVNKDTAKSIEQQKYAHVDCKPKIVFAGA